MAVIIPVSFQFSNSGNASVQAGINQLGQQVGAGVNAATTHVARSFDLLQRAQAVAYGYLISQVTGLMVNLATTVIAAPIKAAADLEQALVKIGTLIPEVSRGGDQFKTALLNMDAALGSTTDLAAGLYEIIQTGVRDSATAMAILPQAAYLANLGYVSMESSAKALASVMQGLNADSSQAGHVAEQLYAGYTLANSSFEVFASKIGTVLPFAKHLGVSLDDLIMQFVSLTRLGIPAAQAFTFISNQMFKLIKPTVDAQKELDKLFKDLGGISTKTLPLLMEQFGGFNGFMREMIQRAAAADVPLGNLMTRIRALIPTLAQANDEAGAFANTQREYPKLLADINGKLGEMNAAVKATFTEQAKMAGINVWKMAQEGADGYTGSLKSVLTIFNEAVGGQATRTAISGLVVNLAQLGVIIGLTFAVPRIYAWVTGLIAARAATANLTLAWNTVGPAIARTGTAAQLAQGYLLAATAVAFGLAWAFDQIGAAQGRQIAAMVEQQKHAKAIAVALKEAEAPTVDRPEGRTAADVNAAFSGKGGAAFIAEIEARAKAIEEMWAKVNDTGPMTPTQIAALDPAASKFIKDSVEQYGDLDGRIRSLNFAYEGLTDASGKYRKTEEEALRMLAGPASTLKKDLLAMGLPIDKLVAESAAYSEAKKTAAKATKDFNTSVSDGIEATRQLAEYQRLGLAVPDVVAKTAAAYALVAESSKLSTQQQLQDSALVLNQTEKDLADEQAAYKAHLQFMKNFHTEVISSNFVGPSQSGASGMVGVLFDNDAIKQNKLYWESIDKIERAIRADLDPAYEKLSDSYRNLGVDLKSVVKLTDLEADAFEQGAVHAKQMARDLAGLASAQEQIRRQIFTDPITRAGDHWRDLADGMEAVNAKVRDWNETHPFWEWLPEAFSKAAIEGVKFSGVIAQIGVGISSFGDITGVSEGFKKAASAIGELFKGFADANTLFASGNKFGGAMVALGSIGQVLGQTSSRAAQIMGGALQGAMSGAAMGALWGSKAGVYGAIAGAVVGGIAAAIGSAKGAWQKVADAVRDNMGFNISQGTAEAIVALKKDLAQQLDTTVGNVGMKMVNPTGMSDVDLRSLLGLDLIIKDIGVTQQNIEKFATLAVDQLGLIAFGGKLAEEAFKHFDSTFGQLSNAAEQLGQRGSTAMLLLVKSARDAGVMTDSMRQDFAKLATEYIPQLDALFGSLGKNVKLTAEEFSVLGEAVAQSFNAMLAAGMSVSEILEKMGPALENLAQYGSLPGLDIIFGLKELSDAAPDAIAKLDALRASMEFLSQIGIVSADVFRDWQKALLQSAAALTKAGASEQQLLILMQPQLALARQLAEMYTYELDPALAAMIKRGEEMGMSFEVGKPVMEDIRDILLEIAAALGSVASQARLAGKEIKNIPAPPGGGVPAPPGGGTPVAGGGGGGAGDRGPKEGDPKFRAEALTNTTIIVNVDGEKWAEENLYQGTRSGRYRIHHNGIEA